MPITHISIQNYKSLRSIAISPKPLTIIVGANSSGKTNFADCLEFIGEVYREGLEVAVSKKGGYENIAFRRQQRSKVPIRIEIAVEFTGEEVFRSAYFPVSVSERKALLSEAEPRLRMTHSYEFVARTGSIRSPFQIVEEKFSFSEWKDGNWASVWSISQDDKKEFAIDPRGTAEENTRPNARSDRKRTARKSYMEMLRDPSTLTEYLPPELQKQLGKNELFVYFTRFTPICSLFLTTARSIGVFQVNPRHARNSGVPSSRPRLGRFGDNLPAVIDEMKKNRREAWTAVLEVMHAILPDLTDIRIDYTPSKQLGLYFRELGYRRAWTVEEVSDGTLQTLALLVAIFDRSSSLLVLEELENSIHPWLIRLIVNTCVEASQTKQIILTTHSSVVIDSTSPENIWVIWREKGESRLQQLIELDPMALQLWTEGSISTFGFIDSGILSEVTPPSPSSSD